MKNKFRKFERHFKMEKNGVFHFVISFVALGPGQIFAQTNLFLGRLFTWIRANSVTDFSGVYTTLCNFLDQSLLLCSFAFAKEPSKNITSFQALTLLSEQKVARFGCLHEMGTVPVKKLTCFIQARFTRVRTIFLHGRILFPDRLFTNSVAVVFTWV